MKKRNAVRALKEREVSKSKKVEENLKCKEDCDAKN